MYSKIYKEKNVIYYMDEEGKTAMRYDMATDTFFGKRREIRFLTAWNNYDENRINYDDKNDELVGTDLSEMILSAVTEYFFLKEYIFSNTKQMLYNMVNNWVQLSGFVNEKTDKSIAYQIIREIVIIVNGAYSTFKEYNKIFILFVKYVTNRLKTENFENIDELINAFKIKACYDTYGDSLRPAYTAYIKYLIDNIKNNISEKNFNRLKIFYKSNILSIGAMSILFYYLYSSDVKMLCAVSKIIENDFKNLYYTTYNELTAFCRIILEHKNIDWKEIVDLNRGIVKNTERMRIYSEHLEEQELQTNLQRINHINNKIFTTIEGEKYIVKVPQNAIDLLDEGKQQNNCVGHYYNESIRQGRNLIYFIRRYENPDKSYLTCRYNIKNKDTVEYRLANNLCCYDIFLIKIIGEINEIISNILEEE